MPSRANVYVDGFNLYYGALRGTSYKWLDLAALCRNQMPYASIHRIRYFTARVKARGNDPSQPQRQQIYLRALGTIPDLIIHEGHFQSNRVTLPIDPPPTSPPYVIDVLRTEEKGSDVNIAAWMLYDAFQNDFDEAVLISNDSDLECPVDMVAKKLRLPVTVLYPQRYGKDKNGARILKPARSTGALHYAATTTHGIAPPTLAASQFPVRLQDKHGIITKPALWDTYSWCEACTTAATALLWIQAGLRCPGCANSRAVAWSVIRLAHAGYPTIPAAGQVYPR